MAADEVQPPAPLKHPCIKCGHETNHLILAVERTIDPDPYFGSEDRYMLVRCQGCGSISFRNEFDDSQDMFVTEDGDLEQNTKVTVHPLILEGHKDLEGIHFLPWHVRLVYEEAIEAIKRQHYVLAAIGLRATIEAICNEQQIEGRSLSTRIGRLATLGLASKRDAANLHAIRFLGNDAAHEIRRPEKGPILLALEIVDHILATTYTLPARAAGLLSPPIDSIEKMKELIETRIESIEPNAAFSLRALLSKDMKRFLDYDSLERQVEALVNGGDFALIEPVGSPERHGRGIRLYKRRTAE